MKESRVITIPQGVEHDFLRCHPDHHAIGEILKGGYPHVVITNDFWLGVDFLIRHREEIKSE